MAEQLLQIQHITKRFAATVALDNVSLSIGPGEVRGLIGENGSGKSTLSSIIAGMQPPTEGSMVWRGEAYRPASALEGAAAGIGMIVQEAGTVPGISIARNLFLGKEGQFRSFGLISTKRMQAEAALALEAIGYTGLDPGKPIDTLDMQQRKLVEVARVMYAQPQILIVDESTTALSQEGRELTYTIMADMKAAGKSVIFISHDLPEIIEHCDSLSVLRDGKLAAELERAEFDESRIRQLLVGRELSGHYYQGEAEASRGEQVVLEIENLTTGHGPLRSFSTQLYAGEILGIGGLSHCGMHELGRAVFGAEPVLTGRITHVPGETDIKSIQDAIGVEMGYVSKDRDREALIMTAAIRENIAGAAYALLQRPGPLILPGTERAYVSGLVESLSIKCRDMDQDVQYLSGGNKQKVVFAKWIGRNAKILVLDCPTRGVDIGVKSAMYSLMEEMKAQDSAILLISEELPELIGMSDRIIILKDGLAQGEFARSPELSESRLIEYMI